MNYYLFLLYLHFSFTLSYHIFDFLSSCVFFYSFPSLNPIVPLSLTHSICSGSTVIQTALLGPVGLLLAALSFVFLVLLIY